MRQLSNKIKCKEHRQLRATILLLQRKTLTKIGKVHWFIQEYSEEWKNDKILEITSSCADHFFISVFSLITKLIASSKMNSSVYNINHQELILGLRYKNINIYFIQLMALNSNLAATLYVYYQMKDTKTYISMYVSFIRFNFLQGSFRMVSY